MLDPYVESSSFQEGGPPGEIPDQKKLGDACQSAYLHRYECVKEQTL